MEQTMTMPRTMTVTEQALAAGRELLDLTSQLEDLESQIKQLTAVKGGLKLQAEELKNELKDLLGGKKLETPELTIAFRKTTSVAITDESKLPAWMIRTKTVKEPNKDLIRQALDDGHAVSGAELRTNLSVTVKKGV